LIFFEFGRFLHVVVFGGLVVVGWQCVVGG
jgi:hypothetical protein